MTRKLNMCNKVERPKLPVEPAQVHFFCLLKELGSDLFPCELIHMLNAKSEININVSISKICY